MSLERDAAREALDDMERTRERARVFSGYRNSGPIFAAWGIAWLGGNLAHYYDLPQPDLIMGGLMFAAVVLSIVLGKLGHRPSDSAVARRKASLGGAVFGITFLGLAVILISVDRLLANAVISYLAAMIYAFAGVWFGARIFALGTALALMTLAAWFGFRDYFELIMGLGGGGALLLTGLWLWRQ